MHCTKSAWRGARSRSVSVASLLGSWLVRCRKGRAYSLPLGSPAVSNAYLAALPVCSRGQVHTGGEVVVSSTQHLLTNLIAVT